MEELKKLDDELYRVRYILKDKEKTLKLWGEIKNNTEILEYAIKVVKDKWGKRDTFDCITILDSMLIDYNNINKDIYNKLVNIIYTNTDIARIVLDGASNGGYSFLLMTLWNENLNLTSEQKAFAVDEAMNKIGTTRYYKAKEEYSKKLEEHGITNDITTSLEIDGIKNPIGAKAKCEYFNNIFNSMSETQAHGVSPFDIRYYILRNHNWTQEEKQKLIMDFWVDDETYENFLDEWEWSIVNDHANYKGNPLPLFDKYELMYETTYEMLLEFYGDETTTKRIWNEIEFCKQMHELRPMEYEKDYILKKE